MNVGIIGAGAIARRGHLPIYATIPEVDVIGIVDVDEALAEKVAREFRIPKYYSSCHELLQDDSIELVDICTPSHTHLEMVRLASAVRKHILVEKPLATSLTDALYIQKAVSDNDIKLCVVQNWRYFPAVLAAKERILRGYLGKIATIHASGLTQFPTQWTLSTWPYHQGGTLYDFGPHVIDLLLWIKDFSPVAKVYASGGDFTQGNMDFINYGVINIEFDDGSIATADISWVTATMLRFTIDISGTGGNIFLDVRNNVSMETHGFSSPLDDLKFFIKKVFKMGIGILNRNYFTGANLYYKSIITNFIHSIEGNGEIPVPVEQAIMTNAVLEAAVISISENRIVYIRDLLESIHE